MLQNQEYHYRDHERNNSTIREHSETELCKLASGYELTVLARWSGRKLIVNEPKISAYLTLCTGPPIKWPSSDGASRMAKWKGPNSAYRALDSSKRISYTSRLKTSGSSANRSTPHSQSSKPI